MLQIYMRKSLGSLVEGTLLAVGGRYDYLLHHTGDFEYVCDLFCFVVPYFIFVIVK